MSGGQLVVLDRLGRDVKLFPLAEGVVTLGSDHSCDIRFMLDTVDPHHATIAVHANQTVVRSMVAGATLVNGRGVSVAALRHGDVLHVGGRRLRWEYARPGPPGPPAPPAPPAALHVPLRGARRAGGRRASGPAPARRDPAVQRALELAHRASMPASAGGKQVAIVQPQRRDTTEQIADKAPRSPVASGKRSRSRGSADGGSQEAGATTKATLWIESRKPASARKATPLRLAVLRRAQSARKVPAPRATDHTKQAAILLMTGHTPKSKLLGQKTPSPKLASTKSETSSRKSTSFKTTPKTTPKSKSPQSTTSNSATPKETPKSASPKSKSTGRRSASFVIKKKSPVVRSTPRGRSSRGAEVAIAPQNHTVTILETTASDSRNLIRSSRRSGHRSFEKSPLLPTPKKSALKNPLVKKSTRKTESIKFDLSNLEYSQESDVVMLSDTTRRSEGSGAGEGEDLTLYYSDSSGARSPSPRRPIHARGGTAPARSPSRAPARSPGRAPAQSPGPASPPAAPRARPRPPSASPRSQPDLEAYSIVDLLDSTSSLSTSVYNSIASSERTSRSSFSRNNRSTIDSTLQGSSTPYVTITKSLSTRSQSTPSAGTKASNASTRSTGSDLQWSDTSQMSNRTRLSNNRSELSKNGPRLSITRSRLSSNSSKFSNRSRLSSDSSKLSTNVTRMSGNRSELSNDETPNDIVVTHKKSQSRNKSSLPSRKTKSLSTPENASIPVSMNSTRISRTSRSRSRINNSDLFLIEPEDTDDSPRSSKRRSSSAPQRGSTAGINKTPVGAQPQHEGTSTPENTHSPEEATTPVFSIQSLLDSSQSSIASQPMKRGGRGSGRGRRSLKRKTIAVVTQPKTTISAKSKSMNFSTRKTRLGLSHDSFEDLNVTQQQDDEVVTPKSAVKLIQEGVKNKHSTAKKPQSKRSIIDNLNESDIVKQLFNGPVKRKLSQSMTEFSRKRLFNEDDVAQARRPTRNTIGLGSLGRSTDDSLLDRTEAFSPEQFVSPINTPNNSPNLTGIKRLFGKTTPQNDLRNVTGVKALLRTPRARKSVRNDLTDVAGVKAVFGRSPRNRLSDVRVKEVFTTSPTNDLGRVSGVKSLFQSQKKTRSPKNSLGDVRGVKKLFTRKSSNNDLRNVSGVKTTLEQMSPKNDLNDVRGVKRLFRREGGLNELSDMSGVEELFNESSTSHRDAESLFDQLVGKPTIKAAYSKTFSGQPKTPKKRKSLRTKSLLEITMNPEQWLEKKLKTLLKAKSRRSQKENDAQSKSKSGNQSRLNATRELQKPATAAAGGGSPPAARALRTSVSALYSARKLPIKKRSFADATVEQADSASKHGFLPIKKRVVVHSTPVKGRQINMTMNASELGRVSPIVAEKTRDLEPDLPTSATEREITEVGLRSGRVSKTLHSAQSPRVKKASPKKTRGKSKVVTPAKPAATRVKNKSLAKPKTPSPAKKEVSLVKVKSSKPVSPKATRSRRKTGVSPKADIKNKTGPAKLIVKKKSPGISTQPGASRKRKEPDPLPTPDTKSKGARVTRNKHEPAVEKLNTPKNSRARVKKLTVVVSKPSPQLKPRATRGRPTGSEVEKPIEAHKAVKPKETRKANVKGKGKNIESPNNSPKQKNQAKEVIIEIASKTRGKSKSTVAKNKSKQTIAEVEKVEPKARRGRTAAVPEPIVSKNTRRAGKQLVQEESKVQAKKAAKQEKPSKAEPKATRGKKFVEVNVHSEPSARSRRGAKLETSEPEVNTRKRKTTAVDERPAKVSKKTESVDRRGRRQKIESPKSKVLETSGKATKKTRKQATAEAPKKTPKSKTADVSAAVPKGTATNRSTRGKKSAVAEVAPVAGKRKRQPALESPPIEAASKKRRGGGEAAGAARGGERSRRACRR